MGFEFSLQSFRVDDLVKVFGEVDCLDLVSLFQEDCVVVREIAVSELGNQLAHCVKWLGNILEEHKLLNSI